MGCIADSQPWLLPLVAGWTTTDTLNAIRACLPLRSRSLLIHCMTGNRQLTVIGVSPSFVASNLAFPPILPPSHTRTQTSSAANLHMTGMRGPGVGIPSGRSAILRKTGGRRYHVELAYYCIDTHVHPNATPVPYCRAGEPRTLKGHKGSSSCSRFISSASRIDHFIPRVFDF